MTKLKKESKEFIFSAEKRSLREYLLWLFLMVFTGLSLWTVAAGKDILVQKISGSLYGKIFVYSFLFSVCYFLFLLVSTFFCRRWKIVYDGDELPECTVLVPAYNEGRHVAETVKSILESDYPAEKFRVIAINDGSVDDTLYWLKKVQKKFPQLTVIDLKENQGKKHALYQGITVSKSDFFVTVDSDSILKKDTLYKIVQPFADEKVGAVAGFIAGKSDVRNCHVRMLDVMLVFGCEFLRRAQSVYGNVFCTPGALSAYRRSAVMPILDQWLNQTFCGREARIGEDRAIATLLLRSGCKIVHQYEAQAFTCLPSNYRGVCKMLLRWTRSDIRENILMTPFVLKNLTVFSMRSVNLFIHWLMLSVNMLLPAAVVPLSIYGLYSGEYSFFHLPVLFLLTVLWSVIPAAVYFRQCRSLPLTVWAFLSGLYNLTGLAWIPLYSMLTVNNSKWLTREVKKKRIS